LSYLESPTLKARIEHVGEIIGDEDDLVSLAGFSMVEGAILYSAFAFLKHYQSQGKNKLMNVVRGINFSVRDENIHSVAGAWSFKHKKSQRNLTPEQEKELHDKIIVCAITLYEHEKEIAKMTFEKGKIDGITETQVVHFVESRINECLVQLGYPKMFEVKYNPIAEWFYNGINNYTFNDFFSGMGNQYHRDWDEAGFIWNKGE
jgi:ribonucleotide reductase beta subunit family protein with ferritin-like domain